MLLTLECFKIIQVVLQGFVSFGPFKHEIIWEKRRTPLMSEMLELKLIGARRGYGRLLFAFALCESLNRNYRGAVLEVLGSAKNEAAIGLYKQFGFEHQKGMQCLPRA